MKLAELHAVPLGGLIGVWGNYLLSCLLVQCCSECLHSVPSNAAMSAAASPGPWGPINLKLDAVMKA